ncbi:MAG: hypothetical protein IJ563_06020 [Selenomonadaceae bacterium]|nr:hypothetical protein [Selenomonadaceae bacterium]
MNSVFTKYMQKKIPVRAIIVFFTFIFFIRNLLLPLVSDDYSYAFIWNGEGGGNISYGITGNFERVTSFYDIIISQWSHYFTWGGRTIAHFIIQFFVWTGKFFFDIANTLVFVLMIFLIYWLSYGQIQIKKLSRITIIWIFFCIWICIPEWVSTMLWLTGACNYLWMAVLQLLFLMPYVLQLYGHQSLSLQKKLIPLIGFIAGWSNEAGGFATLFLAVLITILIKSKNIFQNWTIYGLISFTVGYLLLILAPGNLARMSIVHTDFNWNVSLLIDNLKGPFCSVLSSELLLFVPIIYYLCRRTNTLFSTDEILILMFTAAGLVVPIAMLVSPEFPQRSCFTSPILLLIASNVALRLIFDNKLYPKWLTMENIVINFSFSIIALIWLISIAGALHADVSIYRQTQMRQEIIASQSNKDLILVPPLHPSYRIEKFLGLRIYGSAAINLGGDLNRDEHMGQNILFAKYYGLKYIATTDEVLK